MLAVSLRIPGDGKPLLCQTSSTLLFAGPVGTFLRASMRAVDEQVLMYQRKGVGALTNLTMGTVFNQTAYLQQLVNAEVCLLTELCTVWSLASQLPSVLVHHQICRPTCYRSATAVLAAEAPSSPASLCSTTSPRAPRWLCCRNAPSRPLSSKARGNMAAPPQSSRYNLVHATVFARLLLALVLLRLHDDTGCTLVFDLATQLYSCRSWLCTLNLCALKP